MLELGSIATAGLVGLLILMQATPCIIIAGDSRGRGVADTIGKAPGLSDCTVLDKCRPGADYESLFQVIRHGTREARRYYFANPVIVVLLGGICSFTRKSKTTGEIYYEEGEVRLDEAKKQLSNIWQYCHEHDYHIITATVIPASLQKASERHKQGGRHRALSYSDIERTDQQKNLEKDLEEINKYISEKSREFEDTLISLHRLVTVSSKKGVGRKRKQKKTLKKVDYDNLPDGVHPNEILKEELCIKLTQACLYSIKTIAEKEDPREDSGSSPGWEYKRRKMTDKS